MTLLMVILLGTGALLIISAIEDSPLMATFADVLAGKPIKTAGGGTSGGSGGKSSGGSSDSGNGITGTSINFD